MTASSKRDEGTLRIGRGPVVHRDGDLAFVEGSLWNPEGEVVATATSTIRVISIR
jgi:hypothetical protein